MLTSAKIGWSEGGRGGKFATSGTPVRRCQIWHNRHFSTSANLVENFPQSSPANRLWQIYHKGFNSPFRQIYRIGTPVEGEENLPDLPIPLAPANLPELDAHQLAGKFTAKLTSKHLRQIFLK
jgi:hypothetical protein